MYTKNVCKYESVFACVCGFKPQRPFALCPRSFSSQLQLKIKRLHVCQAVWIVRVAFAFSFCICITPLILFSIILLFRCGEFSVFCLFFALLFSCEFWGFCGYTNQRIVMVSSVQLSLHSAACFHSQQSVHPITTQNSWNTCKIVWISTNIFLARSTMKFHWPHHIMCTTCTHTRDFGRWLKCIVRMTNIHVLRLKISAHTHTFTWCLPTNTSYYGNVHFFSL